VSLTLALFALVFAAAGPGSTEGGRTNPPPGFWRRALMPPRNWPAARRLDFALLNVAIAGGIALSYWLA
jgi:hypothetical protein